MMFRINAGHEVVNEAHLLCITDKNQKEKKDFRCWSSPSANSTFMNQAREENKIWDRKWGRWIWFWRTGFPRGAEINDQERIEEDEEEGESERGDVSGWVETTKERGKRNEVYNRREVKKGITRGRRREGVGHLSESVEGHRFRRRKARKKKGQRFDWAIRFEYYFERFKVQRWNTQDSMGSPLPSFLAFLFFSRQWITNYNPSLCLCVSPLSARKPTN